MACCFCRERDEDTEPIGFPKFAQTPRSPRERLILDHKTTKELYETYVFEKELGVGGFGVVRSVRMKAGSRTVRAVKQVKKSDLRDVNTVRREIAILRLLDHPGICRLYETYEDEKSMYLVLELVEGSDLFEEIQNNISKRIFDECRAAHIMQQVFGALMYCHARGVIHRDLKPENIMTQHSDTQKTKVKIIDFGLAVACDDAYTSQWVQGTPEYLAPEAKNGRSTPASDLWSVGVILHAILLGRLPSGKKDNRRSFGPISSSAQDLLHGLLRVNPVERMSAAQANAHPWTRLATDNGEDDALRQPLPALATDAFTSFHRSCKLRRAALTAVAMQLTGRQLQEFREQFDLIDTDGNGSLSKDELMQAFMESPPEGIQDVRAWVEATFDAIVTNGSGEIEFTEWVAAAMETLEGHSDEALRDAFRLFDFDHTGVISKEDISRVLAENPHEADAWATHLDIQGDGSIDFDGFKALVLQHPSI